MDISVLGVTLGIGGFALTTLALGGIVAPLGQAQSMADYAMPDYYVGGGARFGLNDSASFVLDSKGKIFDLGDFSVSARPAALVGREFELRLPITLEAPLTNRIYPYAGAGIAYNTDGFQTVDPMIATGVDVGLTPNLILDLNLNIIFQSANSDTDAEFAATLNYAF